MTHMGYEAKGCQFRCRPVPSRFVSCSQAQVLRIGVGVSTGPSDTGNLRHSTQMGNTVVSHIGVRI
jgi:hypothetical protein